MKIEEIRQEQEDITLAEAMSLLVDKAASWIAQHGNQPQTLHQLLSLYRYDTATELMSYTQKPAICLIIQGKKRVLLGDEELFYDQNHYLLTSVNLPVVSQVIEASKEEPYIGLTFMIDQQLVARMMLNNSLTISKNQPEGKAMAVSRIDLPLIQSFLRLMNLLDHPEDVPVLGPLIQQEIVYRLLTGEQGKRLQQFSTAGSHAHQIGRAIKWIEDNYDKSFTSNDLAKYSGMSVSSLHNHFRTLTAMTPLQFQKRIRLNTARQIMLMEQKDATSAAFEVGYESASHFSREYSRLFGAPPSRDIKRLRTKTAKIFREYMTIQP